MKKKLLSFLIIAVVLVQSVCVGAEFTVWDSPRYIPADEYKTPWTEEDNPFVTYYAPWLRQMHIMTETEAENNKSAGIVGGEACQKIRQIAISPVDSDVMYLCTDTSGVYKTTTGGKHWYSTTNNAAGHDAKGLLCDKFDKNIVYVYMRKTGVHRSTNGGYSWEQILSDTDAIQNKNYKSDTIVQDDMGNTYMSVGSGIYKLDRATDTITNLTASSYPALAKLTGDSSAEFLDMAVSPDGKLIYACCTYTVKDTGVETGLYVSEDGGNTWEIRNTGSDGSTYSDIRTIALDPTDATCKTIYAGLRITPADSAATGGYFLYKSTDGGKTYTYVYSFKNNVGDNIYFYGLKFGPENTDGIYPLYLCVDGNIDPLRVSYNIHNYSTVTPYFEYVYRGATELPKEDTIREKASTPSKYFSFALDMKKPGRLIFTALGVHEYTLNGDSTSTIKRISSGFSGASLEDIAFDSKGRIFAPVVDVGSYLNTGNIYSSTTYPTFKEGSGISKGVLAIFAPDNEKHIIVYEGISNGSNTYSGITQSRSGGEVFTAMNPKLLTKNPGDGSDWANYGNAQVLCYDNEDVDENGKKSTIYSSYHTSRDNGTTWTRNEYFILDIHPQNTKLQVGIKGTGTAAELWMTENGGVTWTKAMNLFYSDFLDVDFDPEDKNKLWFVRERMIGKIDISTKEIEDYTSKFTYNAFTNVEINPQNPDHILVTSYPGKLTSLMKDDFKLAESYDGGNTWHTVPGLWGSQFNDIIFSPCTDEVFIPGHQGTFIYDYTKFNYYQFLRLWDNEACVKTTLPRLNEKNENVNNGSYIVAPENVFESKKTFIGWKYNDIIYAPGEKIKIED